MFQQQQSPETGGCVFMDTGATGGYGGAALSSAQAGVVASGSPVSNPDQPHQQGSTAWKLLPSAGGENQSCQQVVDSLYECDKANACTVHADDLDDLDVDIEDIVSSISSEDLISSQEAWQETVNRWNVSHSGLAQPFIQQPQCINQPECVTQKVFSNNSGNLEVFGQQVHGINQPELECVIQKGSSNNLESSKDSIRPSSNFCQQNFANSSSNSIGNNIQLQNPGYDSCDQLQLPSSLTNFGSSRTRLNLHSQPIILPNHFQEKHLRAPTNTPVSVSPIASPRQQNFAPQHATLLQGLENLTKYRSNLDSFSSQSSSPVSNYPPQFHSPGSCESDFLPSPAPPEATPFCCTNQNLVQQNTSLPMKNSQQCYGGLAHSSLNQFPQQYESKFGIHQKNCKNSPLQLHQCQGVKQQQIYIQQVLPQQYWSDSAYAKSSTEVTKLSSSSKTDQSSNVAFGNSECLHSLGSQSKQPNPIFECGGDEEFLESDSAPSQTAVSYPTGHLGIQSSNYLQQIRERPLQQTFDSLASASASSLEALTLEDLASVFPGEVTLPDSGPYSIPPQQVLLQQQASGSTSRSGYQALGGAMSAAATIAPRAVRNPFGVVRGEAGASCAQQDSGKRDALLAQHERGTDASTFHQQPQQPPQQQQAVQEREPDESKRSDERNQQQFQLPAEFKQRVFRIGQQMARCMLSDGICVVDNFLGRGACDQVLACIKAFYATDVFKPGLVISNTQASGTVRGDKILWLDGSEPGANAVAYFILQMDLVVKHLEGKLGRHVLSSRTKAMVAVYPGHGARYVRHVDNPGQDGRCITCIYYVNRDWDPGQHGGLTRIYPRGTDRVAEIVPIFDRLLVFWSDRRCPHEVLPAHRLRYAITLWYFDEEERRLAIKRQQDLVHEAHAS